MYNADEMTRFCHSSSRKASISCEIDFLLWLYVVVVLRLFQHANSGETAQPFRMNGAPISVLTA